MVRRAAAALVAVAALLTTTAPADAGEPLPRFPGRRICVEHVAAAHYPVAAVADAWDASTLVVAYGRGWRACHGWRHVIRVHSDTYSASWAGWGGFPRRGADGRSVAHVRLNDRHTLGWSRQHLTWLISHEIGHTLGRARHASRRTASVMQTAPTHPLPTTHDLRWANRHYR